MTNILAFWLGVFILGFLAVDFIAFRWEMSVFLGRKMLDLIEYTAFWR